MPVCQQYMNEFIHATILYRVPLPTTQGSAKDTAVRVDPKVSSFVWGESSCSQACQRLHIFARCIRESSKSLGLFVCTGTYVSVCLYVFVCVLRSAPE